MKLQKRANIRTMTDYTLKGLCTSAALDTIC